MIVGQGALARADGARRPGARGARLLGVGRHGGLERFLRAAHGGGARRRRSISASCRARAGSTPAPWRRRGRSTSLFNSRRRRDRHRARRLRGLPGHAWRPRRAPRRRDPAGRGLHGKVAAPTSTPKAACSSPTAPSSRRAMPARTGRSCARSRTCSARRLPFDSLAALRADALRGSSAFRAHRRDRASDAAGPSQTLARSRRHARPRRRSRAPIARFLPDQPDRARFGRHGGMLGARPRPALDRRRSERT